MGKIKEEVGSWSKAILLALGLVLVVHNFLFVSMKIEGVSMYPSFNDKDRVLVSKVSSIDRFDIIVFHPPKQNGDYFIKRVIGLPGDRVEMIDNQLYINGKLYNEEYVNGGTGSFEMEWFTGETIVPEGKYFVLGDNRMRSRDSRHFGFVEDKSIEGEVVLRYYPFHQIRSI